MKYNEERARRARHLADELVTKASLILLGPARQLFVRHRGRIASAFAARLEEVLAEAEARRAS